MAEPVASAADPQPRQILARRQAKQGSDFLIELERGKTGAPGEIRNAERRVEMLVDVGESVREGFGRGSRPRRRGRVARNAGKTPDGAVEADQRLLPGQAPALAAVGIEMKLEPAADRKSFREHPAVLLLETIPERRGEDFAGLVADQRPLAGDLAAKDERFIDSDISRVLVLDEEDDVADAIEKLNSRERASEGGGEFQGRVGRSDGGRRLFANFQAAACFCIKKERPRHAKVTAPKPRI